ncbi:MAG: hypothetical protein U1F76_19995 [Candidatus Competibacteraceae bacterium]
MAQAIAYRVKSGGHTAASRAQESDCQLLSLRVDLDMDGVGGHCAIELGDSTIAVQPGAAVKVELDAGDGMLPVFTGQVDNVRIGASSQWLLADDSLAALARLDLEAAYQDVKAGFIVKDIFQQAGVTAGEVVDGPQLPTYVLHRGPRALRHLQTLAELCGADLYTDGQGRVHCAVPRTGGTAEQTFRHGENILTLDLHLMPPAYDSVEVWGEGAASSQGADKYYWLVTDLTGVNGKAALTANSQVNPGSLGKLPRPIYQGAVRSGEAARGVAEAQVKALAARWLRGHIEVYGTPGVEPGHRVQIVGLPTDHSATAVLASGHLPRVRRVQHRLDRQRGLLTRLDF